MEVYKGREGDFSVTASPLSGAVLEEVQMAYSGELRFLTRWRLAHLRRVDAQLYDRLVRQRELFGDALSAGRDEIHSQAQAMKRGWNEAIHAMQMDYSSFVDGLDG